MQKKVAKNRCGGEWLDRLKEKKNEMWSSKEKKKN
jgi:hypothetical protein